MRSSMLAVALAIAALGSSGCKKKAPPANGSGSPTADAAAAPADAGAFDAAGSGEPPPLTPPVPSGKVGIQVVGLEYEGYDAKLLPAIRADGAQMAVASLADDGGRGYLDLSLIIVDTKASKVLETRRLADPEETSAGAKDDGTLDPALLAKARTRVAEANALLAASEWRSLQSHLAEPGDPETPIVAAGINWTLEVGDHLVGKRAGKVVFDRTYAKLTGKPAPRASDDDDMCPDVIILSSVHVDEATGQALIGFGRMPGHNCGAPGEDLAVITLPR